VIPDAVAVEIDATAWTLPPVFDWLRRTGNVPLDEMVRVFNCGVGLVVIVAPADAERAIAALAAAGDRAWRIGQVRPRGDGEAGCMVAGTESWARP
jgi:phosphoribosylaminoimidazole (AIR) synthetase